LGKSVADPTLITKAESGENCDEDLVTLMEIKHFIRRTGREIVLAFALVYFLLDVFFLSLVRPIASIGWRGDGCEECGIGCAATNRVVVSI
jgi:hypothetical protein